MGRAGGIISSQTSGVSFEDIRQVVGITDKEDIEGLINAGVSRGLINKWAKVKPIHYPGLYELTDAVKKLAGEKQNIEDYLDIFQFWFRDVLMFKATREMDHLVFKQQFNDIREQAGKRSYENLEKILEAIEMTRARLRANVNMELAVELLFMTVREK
ncbi:MAG: hypothetical protein IIY55_07070 [Blautia sp.]|nr:hypothetical protein [Blautia sp.]